MLKINIKVRDVNKDLENIKVGDIIVCGEGFTKEENSGGAGYKADLPFKVTGINSKGRSPKDRIYFGGENGHGVFGRAIRKVIKEL